MSRCTSEHRAPSGGVIRCQKSEGHQDVHFHADSGTGIEWAKWMEPVASGGAVWRSELKLLRAENARLRELVGELEARMEALRKALGVP